MLWQYLLLATAIPYCIESKVDRDGKKKHGVRGNHRKSNLRIRNEYPMHLQGGKFSYDIKSQENYTNTERFPYMAAVIINGRMWCAGAIVDVNWVLTAAHCINYVLKVNPLQNLAKVLKARIGSIKAYEGGTLMDVEGAIRHPKYELEPVPHADVALLKLVDNIEFHKYVSLIKIYYGVTEPYAQSFIEVSGWGATKTSESNFHDHTRDLLTARLKARPQQYCIDSYQLVDAFQFTNDFFCASLRNGTRDACLFDAGAPAVQNNQLMGIMSFGPEKCGHYFQPAVFIKAFYFRSFVKKTIAEYKSSKEEHEVVTETFQSVEVNKATPDPGDYGPANIMLLSNSEEKAEKVAT